ncbi:MAG: carbamoyl-phosphate synthase large subunit, partial [Candidatus Micrarchaeaceae archaeon]
MENKAIKKVLVIGSGPIKIAEAAEFDYSANQALKALREEGIETIILSSNIATVQTDKSVADKVYLLPVKYDFAKKVIEKERPDGIMIGFGGQSALNVGIDLYNAGVLKEFNVKLLGTPISGIQTALSRNDFKEKMRAYGIPVPKAYAAKTEDEAAAAAKKVGYPVMLRVSFNLGGRGSFVAHNRAELDEKIARAFAQSRSGEVLIERYLENWKEIEYEVVRDIDGNSIAVACLENIDPMGVHTGDSIVVAPAQTLDNYEYQSMRSTAIKVAEAIGLVGECNVQFALDQKSSEFFVIETNPRMSRSSALASKATGYPLAYIATKLALGKRLHELKNNISNATSAFFEPSLDYITIKMPYWDFDKFGMEGRLGTEMRSIGEVMAIGRSIEEAFMKGIKMLDLEHAVENAKSGARHASRREIIESLKSRKPYWFIDVIRAVLGGVSTKEISAITGVDRFFIEKIANLAREDSSPKSGSIYVKQIDTLAGEYPANMNYLYTTAVADEDDIKFGKKKKLLILGAGRFRIGVSVEFDYSAVLLARSAKRYFDEVAILNHNPETVSTDWDTADKLYFDSIDENLIKALNAKEKFSSVATFAAGQIGNDLALRLENSGIKIFGTKASSIECAENRAEFSDLLSRLGIRQPDWTSAANITAIKRFVEAHGFPVLVRPSHVLSGTAMKIAYTYEELIDFINRIPHFSKKYPVVISKFMSNAIEAEVDAVADGNGAIGTAIEHIEEAGVHSGDSTMVTPVHAKYARMMKDVTLRLVRELEIKGPLNLQFVVRDNKVYVIELNLRASRSLPFSSKALGINLLEKALRGSAGSLDIDGFFEPAHNYYTVKSPQFSWLQMQDAYPSLGPEMKSTGESGAFGASISEALLKSWLGVQPNKIPKPGSEILIYGVDRKRLMEAANLLYGNFDVVTLEGSHSIDSARMLSSDLCLEGIRSGKIDLVITDGYIPKEDFYIRRLAADMNVPLVLNARLALALSNAIKRY